MDIDVTFLFQLGLFLICLVGLNGILLKPYLRVIEDREAKIEGARDASEGLRKQGDADMDAYQLQIRKARIEADRARETFREEGRGEERKLLAAVRAEIADQLNRSRVEVSQAELEAKRNLTTDTESLARLLVGKVLGREVRP